VLPLIREELRMGLVLAGWILSTFTLIGLVLGSASGAAADALGHRRILLAGLFLQAFGCFLGRMAWVSWLLFLSRILEGLGFLLVIVTAPALIFKVSRTRDMRLALSGWSCYIPIGVSIIMLVAPVLTSRYGWRGLWIINGILLFGYALLLAWFTRAQAHVKTRRRTTLLTLLKDIGTTSTSTGPLLLAFIFSTYSLQWLAVMGFLPTLLMEEHNMGLGGASIFTASVVAINIPGNLTGGWLMSKGAPKSLLIITASAITGSCSLLIYASGLSLPIRYAGCLLFSGIGGLLPAALFSGVPIHAPRPDLVATTNGIVMQGSQLGQTVGPPILALLVSHHGGWHVGPWLLCTSAAIGIVLTFFLAYKERRSPTGDAER
jgi:MFS family permease